MRKLLKVILYILGSIILLALLLIVLLQTPWGKNMVRKEAVKFLSQKLGTEVALQRLDYTLTSKIALEGLFVRDKKGDTLAYMQQMVLKMDMLALIKGKVAVDQLLLQGVTAQVSRHLPDTTFNYDFIISAFASGKDTIAPAPKDTAGSRPMELDIVKVELKDIKLRYDDETGGILFTMNLGQLLLRPKKIDLARMRFDIEELGINGLQSYVATDTSHLPSPPKDTTSTDLLLSADKMRFSDVKFAFLGRQDSTFFSINAGLLDGKLNRFDLREQWVDIDKLQLEQVKSILAMGKPTVKGKKTPPQTESDSAAPNDWRVVAGTLMLKQIGFLMDNNAEPRLAKGMDYAHLDIQGFSLNASDVKYGPDTISANLKHLALKEKSGLDIIELRTNFVYSDQGADLKDLFLMTPGTQIRHRVSVNYASLVSLENRMGEMRLLLDIDKSKIAINDVLIFMPPGQRAQLAPYANQEIRVAAQITGPLNALNIKSFQASGLGGTEVDLKGMLKGLPNADKLHYDLTIARLKSTEKDIAPFLTDTIRQQFRIPDWFLVTGRLRGTAQDYYPDILVKTSDGDLSAKGSIAMSPGEGKETFDLELSTARLALGRILRMDTLLGTLDARANVKGRGFDIKTMQADFDARIQSLGFKGYDYTHIDMAGHIERQVASVTASSTDPNVAFQLKAQADLSGTYPSLIADLNMDRVDPRALGFYGDTLELKGRISADFESLNPDYPVGKLMYARPEITLAGRTLRLDSIFLSSRPTNDSVQNIALDLSNIVRLDLQGKIPLTQIGNAVLDHIDTKFDVVDTLAPLPFDYGLSLKSTIAYQPVLRTFLPGLRPFDTIRLNAELSPTVLDVNAWIPKLVFGKNRVDSGVIKIYEAGDTLRYAVSSKKIDMDQIRLWYPSVTGSLRNDSVYVWASLKDSLQKSQFALGGAIHHDLDSDSGLTYIRMFKGLLLDYERWDVQPMNRIVLGPKGFFIKDFGMSKGNESITANSRYSDFNAPLDLSIKNFALSNLTRMLSGDTLLADGLLNVDAQVDFKDSLPAFQGSASIQGLKVFDQAMGALEANIASVSDKTFRLMAKLSGSDNDVRLTGDYYLEPQNGNDFKMKLDVNALSLKSMEGLSFGALKNSSGFIRGTLDIYGTPARPLLIGSLSTDRLQTTVKMLNAPLSMPSDIILFTKEGIVLDNFTIEDRNGKSAFINGKVKTKDYRNYTLDLGIRTNRWQALHSKKTDNELFYGDLFLSANLNVKGDAMAPVVDGSLTIHDSTKLTYAMIDEGPGIQESEGIVRFYDSRDVWVDSSEANTDNEARITKAVEMNVNVDIQKQATFNVIIDPSTGDNLQVKGEANLNTFIGPGGAIGLTGTYELQDGYYELNYNFIKRKFNIKSGSVITLSGEPMDADVDITAVYAANIAPYELMEKQVQPTDLNLYKQRLPFDVELKLKGKVLKPQIAFDIVLPENKMNKVRDDVGQNVQNKLSEIRYDPSVLNKQVFAVLILGRFIADDPFASGLGGGFEYAARQSASRFLSDQLNNIAGQLIHGLDLNVGLETQEDYSTGEKANRTDLSISASKKLFDDRLSVTVGNDFQLEGQQAQTQQSTLIPGNLSADYKLTQDGKYMVRAYRVNQLQNIIDGYVVETGVSFRISIEYNRFKYIFRSRSRSASNGKKAANGHKSPEG